jgi:hypothetical protein
MNQILEDMLRMHVMHQPKKWEDYLPLVEFAYNNGYQQSLKMSPFEVLYGSPCNTPVSWSNPVNRISFGTDMSKEMEQQVTQIKQNPKVAQDRQKIYVDQKRTPREFKTGDHVYLRVRPRKSSLKMGACAIRKAGPWSNKIKQMRKQNTEDTQYNRDTNLCGSPSVGYVHQRNCQVLPLLLSSI